MPSSKFPKIKQIFKDKVDESYAKVCNLKQATILNTSISTDNPFRKTIRNSNSPSHKFDYLNEAPVAKKIS
jgi:hypothetical protein